MADPRISTVRAAWETTIKTAIPQANVSGWFNDGEKLPRIQLIEDTTDSVRSTSDFGDQYAQCRYIVRVEESGTDGLSAAKRLDQYVSWDHDRSITKAMYAAPRFGLAESVLKSINIATTWTVNPDLLTAELPVTFYVVKS